MSKSLTGILVENNPYDRAVIDAALESTPNIALHYTAQGCAGPLGLANSDWQGCLLNAKPDFVLLDLALGARCEEELPRASFQNYIRQSGGVLKALIDQLEEELEDMEPVAHASFFLCEALAAEPQDRAAALSHLAGGGLSPTVLSRIESLFVVIASSRTPTLAQIDAALTALWRGKRAVADLAKQLSRAPSLWRLLICIAKNPDVCFFLISHYATPAMLEPLKDLLAARLKPEDPDFYSSFIINKSDLSDLGERLTEAYGNWCQEHALVPVVEPFAAYPVLVGKTAIRFEALITQWTKDHLEEEPPRKQVILWDETGTFDGGLDRWKFIQRRWRNGLDVLSRSALDAPAGARARRALIIDPTELKSPAEAAKWAAALNKVLQARAASKLETLIVVRGNHMAYPAAVNKLTGIVWHRIPAFFDKTFSKQMDLRQLVGNLAVVSDGVSFHVETWNKPQPGTTSRPLEEVLADLCANPGEATARMVYYLESKSKQDLGALQNLAARIEYVLTDLKLTKGEEQDWGTILENAGLEQKPRKFNW